MVELKNEVNEMDAITLLKERRSIRRFKNEKVSRDVMNENYGVKQSTLHHGQTYKSQDIQLLMMTK